MLQSIHRYGYIFINLLVKFKQALRAMIEIMLGRNNFLAKLVYVRLLQCDMV